MHSTCVYTNMQRCMYICACIYKYTCICGYSRLYADACAKVDVCICTRTCLCLSICICMHVYIYTHKLCVYIHVHIRICIHTCIFICSCSYNFMGIERSYDVRPWRTSHPQLSQLEVRSPIFIRPRSCFLLSIWRWALICPNNLRPKGPNNHKNLCSRGPRALNPDWSFSAVVLRYSRDLRNGYKLELSGWTHTRALAALHGPTAAKPKSLKPRSLRLCA